MTTVSTGLSTRVRRGGVKTGCLIVLLVVVVVLIIGGVYVARNARSWTAQGMVSATEAVLSRAQLPQDQKNQILAQVQAFGDDFKAGKVSVQQLQQVAQEIAQSPLVPLAALQYARQKYIEPSDMTPEEKAAAIRSLQRFARGVYEQKITPAQKAIDEVVKPIADLKPDGRWELQDKPKRQDLDQFIANAKARADEAKIPDEPFDLNIAEELKKAIDKGRGQAAGGSGH